LGSEDTGEDAEGLIFWEGRRRQVESVEGYSVSIVLVEVLFYGWIGASPVCFDEDDVMFLQPFLDIFGVDDGVIDFAGEAPFSGDGNEDGFLFL
jgi:hypothetical protein